jgi:hypothetical protein
MAIKVSNTTVIDDSRNITNIGTATVGTANITTGNINTANITTSTTTTSTSTTGNITTANITTGNITTANVSTAANLSGTTTMTGTIRTLGSQGSSIIPVAAVNIDCSLGNYFTKTIAADTAFTFSNIPTGVAYAFTLKLTHTSGNATWPASVKWPVSGPPIQDANRTSLLMFITDDGGARWRGVAIPNYEN